MVTAAPHPLESVLVLDDEPASAASLRSSFQALGLRAEVASTARQALSMIERAIPDLLVTELRLNGRWTFGVVGELKRLRPAAKVMVVTAYPSVATAVQSALAGVDEYVTKPVNACELLHRLQGGDCSHAAEVTDAGAWPSLARTTWEYLNQVLVSAGSLSEAARRLGLD